jgi:hypothetical protein
MRPALLGLAFLAFPFALAAQVPPPAKASPPALSAERIGNRIDVTIGGEFFTSYRFAEDEKYPFLFPVNGPSGASVTSMRNGRFPHHSSVFFGCDKVNGGNYWQDRLNTGRIVSSGPVLVSASGSEVVITDTCLWSRPGAPSPFRDRRRLTFSAPTAGLRQIDFDIELEALEDVLIGKTNHSLLGIRLDPDLAPVLGGAMVDAEGRTGESGTFGKPSPWLAAFGDRGRNAPEGLALLQHPSNPGSPAPWFTRDYGFLSPTPMFWPADGVATRLARGSRLALRYRILIFSGDPASADVAGRYRAYALSPAAPFPE